MQVFLCACVRVIHGLLSDKKTWLCVCLGAGAEENKREKKKKKKRVRFAEDVVDPSGDGEEFRRQHDLNRKSSNPSSSSSASSVKFKKTTAHKYNGMPPNRAALYDGILRDRGVHRLAYSY